MAELVQRKAELRLGDVYNHMVEDLSSVSAHMRVILANQVLILAHLEKRPPEEVVEDLNKQLEEAQAVERDFVVRRFFDMTKEEMDKLRMPLPI